jgi:hypothetical protein
VADHNVNILLKAKDAASGPIGRVSKAMGGLSTAAGVLAGVGLVAVAAGLGEAVKGALAEEKSIAKLDAALKANVKNWDGNREAIEGVLAARMDLGFSDDEQRESLSLLVAATHDSTKALELQRTAMDLARLKNISLSEASEALVKVEGGQFRLLKSLGIELDKNATQQDALTAVQRVATGQADAYANTSGGKLLKAQIKVGEALEKIGTVVLPVLADALSFVADKAVMVIEWFQKTAATLWAGGKSPLAKGVALIGDGFRALAGAIGFVIDKVASLIQWIKDAVTWLVKLNKDVEKFVGFDPTFSQPMRLGPFDIGGKAAGGPVMAGRPYVVGERGPELFIPDQSGGIVPHGRWGMTGGGSTVRVINVMLPNGRVLASVIDEENYYRQRRAPQSALSS